MNSGNPYRAVRGGSWSNLSIDCRAVNLSIYCRASNRGWFAPGNRSVNLGFRLAIYASTLAKRDSNEL